MGQRISDIGIRMRVGLLVSAGRNAPPWPDQPLPAGANEADALRRLTWRSIGPANNAGRISDIVGIPGDVNTYYVAAASGGIWKTTNGGTTFKPDLRAAERRSPSARSRSRPDPDVDLGRHGRGQPAQQRRRSATASTSPPTAARPGSTSASRHARTSRASSSIRATRIGLRRRARPRLGPERRARRLHDDGRRQDWQKTLYMNTARLLRHRHRPDEPEHRLRGRCTRFRRKPWTSTSGGERNGALQVDRRRAHLERSSTRGLPKRPMDRIGVSVARSEPERRLRDHGGEGRGHALPLRRRGETWRHVNSRSEHQLPRRSTTRDLRVDPTNANRVFSLSGGLFVSDRRRAHVPHIARGMHGDHHALWIDPTDPERMLGGSDGGWHVSMDGGHTWDFVNNIALGAVLSHRPRQAAAATT